MRSRKAGICFVVAILAVMALLPEAVAQELIEATTASGEKVRLHPNGRWEYLDAQKAVAAKTVVDQSGESATPAGRPGLHVRYRPLHHAR